MNEYDDMIRKGFVIEINNYLENGLLSSEGDYIKDDFKPVLDRASRDLNMQTLDGIAL